MKWIPFLLVTVLAIPSMAAKVHLARLDLEKKNILIDVSYAGGCGDHQFSLKVGGCFETFPVQCEAELDHQTVDPCEALLSGTLVISLKDYGLDTKYYSNASFTITGEVDSRTRKASSASLQLPKQ